MFLLQASIRITGSIFSSFSHYLVSFNLADITIYRQTYQSVRHRFPFRLFLLPALSPLFSPKRKIEDKPRSIKSKPFSNPFSNNSIPLVIPLTKPIDEEPSEEPSAPKPSVSSFSETESPSRLSCSVRSRAKRSCSSRSHSKRSCSMRSFKSRSCSSRLSSSARF